MRVVLIRHTSVDVPRGTCYGWTDVPVAATFAQEAAATKETLGAYGPFDAVFTSPLTRARRLAAFCGYPDAVADERLKEMNMGEWEMQRYDDISDPYLQRWYNDYLHLPTPGGESFAMQQQRVAAFLDDLRCRPCRQVAVFAHAGVLVCASIYARLFAEAEAWQHIVPYGGMMEITLAEK